MKSPLRLCVLLVHVCIVLAESIKGVCDQLHDGIECFDTSGDEQHMYTDVHEDTHKSDRYAKRDQCAI